MQDGPTGRPHDHDHDRMSLILRELVDSDAERIRVGDVVDAFGPRAFGALLFVFALLSLVAAVPGSSAIMAAPILVIAPQLILGVPNLWLPGVFDRRSVRRDDLRKVMDRVLPLLERVERLLAPRFHFVVGSVGDRLAGVVCFLLAVVLALPIPFFNLAPGSAIAVLGLGLAARDGIVVLIGYGIAAGCAVVLILSANVVIIAIQRMMHMFGA